LLTKFAPLHQLNQQEHLCSSILNLHKNSLSGNRDREIKALWAKVSKKMTYFHNCIFCLQIFSAYYQQPQALFCTSGIYSSSDFKSLTTTLLSCGWGTEEEILVHCLIGWCVDVCRSCAVDTCSGSSSSTWTAVATLCTGNNM